MSEDPDYGNCMRYEALHDHECGADPLTGRMIEWEHALIHAGKQIQKKHAIVALCWWTHRGPGMVKRINEWIALNRATTAELISISKAMDYFRYKSHLDKMYGVYNPTKVSGEKSNNVGTMGGIAYGQPVDKRHLIPFHTSFE